MAEVTIEQLIYGPRDQRVGYQILAQSPGIDLAGKLTYAVIDLCNLGGSVLRGGGFEPFIAFHPLNPEKTLWGFLRTVCLGQGARGTDYLGHLLIASEIALEALRWDVFLLESFFQNHPPEQAVMETIHLDSAEVEKKSTRSWVSVRRDSPRVRDSVVDFLFDGLISSPLAVEVADAALGRETCLSLYLAMPPSDRRESPFASQFPYERPREFRLICYSKEDFQQVKGFAANHRMRESATMRQIDETEFGDRSPWLELLRSGIGPLQGLSLLKDRGTTMAIASFLTDSLRVASDATGGIGTAAASLSEGLLRRIDGIVLDPSNRESPGIERILPQTIVRLIIDRTKDFLSGSPLPALREELRSLMPAPKNSELPGQVCSLLRRVNQGSMAEVCTLAEMILTLLLSPGLIPLERLFGDFETQPLFASAEEVGRWLASVHRQNPNACLDIIGEWFTALRIRNQRFCLDLGIGIILFLRGRGQDSVIRTVLAAMEGAVNDSGRADWHLSMIEEIQPLAPGIFTTAWAARLAARSELFPRLSSPRLLALVPDLVESFPDTLSIRFNGGESPTPEIGDAVFLLCRAGISGTKSKGKNWNFHDQPGLWKLSCRSIGFTVKEFIEHRSILPEREIASFFLGALMLTRPSGDPAELPEENAYLKSVFKEFLIHCSEASLDFVINSLYILLLLDDSWVSREIPLLWPRLRSLMMADRPLADSLNRWYGHFVMIKALEIDRRLTESESVLDSPIHRPPGE